MDPAGIVALVAVAANVALLLVLAARLASQDDLLAARLAAQDEERAAWARERWELNTRIQAPEVVAVSPPAPPLSPAALERVLSTEVPVEVDEDERPFEDDMIGRVA